mgnify:CR=1 FL=1
MSSTFDIFSIKSLPSDYRWDKGTPGIDYTGNFITELSACSAISSNPKGVEYVGYAPFVFVSLSSTAGDISDTHLALTRTADFGDYYNSESNFVTVPTLSDELGPEVTQHKRYLHTLFYIRKRYRLYRTMGFI